VSIRYKYQKVSRLGACDILPIPSALRFAGSSQQTQTKNGRTMTNYFQRLAALALAIALFCSCDDDDGLSPAPNLTFQQIGLDNLKVYELVLYGEDSLFAATNDGIYVKEIDSADPFVHIGLKGRNVLDLVVFTPEHIIVATGNRGFISDTNGIHETLNGGSSWEKSNFGDDGNEEPAHSLSKHPTIEGTVYATGSTVVAKSVDYGKNWEVIWGNWGGFASGVSVAAINPFVETDLWYGGQGGIENGYLGYLRNEQQVKQWDDLVDNPTVAVEVAFTNPGNHIFAGFEGALMKTSNNGDTWKQVIDGHTDGLRFFYGIGKSDVRQSHLYAGGWLKGVDEQSLVLYVSQDSGETWQIKTFEDEKAGGIYSLKVISEGNRDRVFVGLDGGGVYEVR
jgi:photosystem II stability/assembly factor-like uncharacterized protein